jgi:hypothetical protein
LLIAAKLNRHDFPIRQLRAARELIELPGVAPRLSSVVTALQKRKRLHNPSSKVAGNDGQPPLLQAKAQNLKYRNHQVRH